MTGEKTYVSHTQLEMYCRCGEQYRRRYVEHQILPPAVALHRGRAVHHAAAQNFSQKKETREDLAAATIRDLAVASYDAGIAAQGVTFHPDETSAGHNRIIGQGRDQTARFAHEHATSQAPAYQPALVEYYVRIPIPNASRDLLAVIDLLDDRHHLVDFKNQSRSMNQADADASTQMTIYAAAVAHDTGKPPAALCYDVLVDRSRGVTREVISTTRDRADLRALARRIQVVTQAIDAGVFLPPPSGNAWWCSSKWCGYYCSCPYVRSRP